MAKRDDSLDLIKGVACILMVLSHAGIETQSPFLLGLGFLGSFAAVSFFSVSGVTTWMQAKKYHPKEIIPPYIILFLAGLSFNGMYDMDFYRNFEMEILQIIAVGVLFVYLLQYYLKPPLIVLFFTGLLVFLIKISLDQLAPRWEVVQIIKNSWLIGIFLAPGTFTIIPWLFIFPLGVFAYRSSARTNLILASIVIFLILGILVITQDPASFDLENKWDMSIGYFLFSCFFLFFSYYLVKRIAFKENLLYRFLLFLGRNSLLFLFVHIMMIFILSLIGMANLMFIYWLLVIFSSAFLLRIITANYPKLHLDGLFHHKITWYFLVFGVLITPVVIKNRIVIFLLDFLWGILLSENFSLLREIFKHNPPTIQNSDITSYHPYET